MSFDLGGDDGDAALIAMIARLRAFGKSALADAAREAAPLVEAVAKEQAAAGLDPYGVPWRVRADGSRPFPDAASHIVAEAKGERVILRSTSRGESINNNLKEERRRLVVPRKDRPLPRAMVDAMKEGVRIAFEKAMK